TLCCPAIIVIGTPLVSIDTGLCLFSSSSEITPRCLRLWQDFLFFFFHLVNRKCRYRPTMDGGHLPACRCFRSCRCPGPPSSGTRLRTAPCCLHLSTGRDRDTFRRPLVNILIMP